jgi:hypothetical protein
VELIIGLAMLAIRPVELAIRAAFELKKWFLVPLPKGPLEALLGS